ncbi:MAG TPA: TrmH family RNA methyltransferase [Candidatus Saccharimonadales bacterium]|nr:TrmH family RNA methyltransferase [Candidatus Saccharimonadales bacterium]
MRTIVVIAHDIRSTHNVGSLLRTCEGLGVQTVYLTGYTPYPRQEHDLRLPHIADKLTKQIQKTALGAETLISWQHETDVRIVLAQLHQAGFQVAALEQAGGSQPLPRFRPPDKLALLLGREVEGIEPELVALCDTTLEIPMFGQKESFNVVQAAAMALYHCRFA